MAYGYFEIENSGVTNNSTIKFSPFHTNSVIEASASNNSMWDLEILTPSNDLSAHINNLAGLYFYPKGDKVGVLAIQRMIKGIWLSSAETHVVIHSLISSKTK